MYEHVLSPIMIGNVEIPNRVVRTAHATGFVRGVANDRVIAYHAARARGGVGLTILEIMGVHPSSPASFMAFMPGVLEGHKRLMDAINPYGMKVFQQLWHAGHGGTPIDGSAPWSASDVPNPLSPHVPRAMTRAQVNEVIEAYVNAARLCREAGLHGVEVHGAHGYLLQQFLSPNTNKREDEYGGSLENRMRLLLEVMRATHAEATTDFAVGVRLATDLVNFGVGVEENQAVVKALRDEGLADFVNISLGNYQTFPKMIGGMHEPAGYELETAVPIGACADVPVIVTGRFRTLEEAEQVIRRGDADLVGMTRATIADPEIVNKTRAKQEDRVRPCIACNQGCLGGLMAGTGVACAVNAAAGFEETLGDDKLAPVATPRKILVIGGGPAGMEAARVAAKRGHKVVLAEATADLGGTLRYAAMAPTRHQFTDFVQWAQNEVYAEGVDVRLSTYVTKEDVKALAPDHVILATGAEPRVDGIQLSHPGEPMVGVELDHVISSNELFSRQKITVTNALVVDDTGHYEALAAAEFLIAHGASVNLVTRHTSLAPGMEGPHMVEPFLERMAGKPFSYHVNTRVLRVDGQSAAIQSIHGGSTVSVNADLVVFVSLNRPRDELATVLEAAKVPYSLVGDVRSPGFLVTAISQGHTVASMV
jgi:2,4-dienoyl-CoA reductase-like NADH-dependent reductase (Old Yellow Enzyme family)/pyruvate/2-oxoglutarate dehydrogenase complex dihydrolipoamide dehydrogenase (E3) component